MSKIQINAIVLLCLSGLWFAGMQRIPDAKDDLRLVNDFAAIPDSFGDWWSEGSEAHKSKDLPTASLLDRNYRDSDGNIAMLSIVYCTSLGDLHQPEFCLGGQGWSCADRAEPVLRPKGRQPLKAMMSWIQNESTGHESVALYWFNCSAAKDTLLPWFKMKVYWSRLTGVELPGVALVRIMVPTGADPDRAKEAAKRFATQVSPYIDDMMSQPTKTEKL